jgi:5'(3')-deoxyribonucleotidase
MEGYCRDHLGLEYLADPKLAWSVIDKIPHFFKELEPIKGSLNFFDDILLNAKVEVKILTALPLLTGELITAAADKREWVKQFLDADIQVITVDSWERKKDFSKGNVLLDDSRRNILDWEYHGGQGVWHTSKDCQHSWNQLKKCGVL